MRRSIIILLLLTASISLFSSPLHSKSKHSIIIDTDCNGSDLNAISLLLSHPGITVKAIILTAGWLDVESGEKKIMELLSFFNADTIPIIKDFQSDKGMAFCELFAKSKEELIYLSIGPLSGIARIKKDHADIYDKIEEIIWYNDRISPFVGFNYENDRKAADEIIRSGKRIDIISAKPDYILFDTAFYENSCQSETRLARYLNLNKSQYLQHTDSEEGEEITAIYLGNHELFEIEPLYGFNNVRYNKGCIIDAVKEVVNDLAAGRYRAGHFTAFYEFPVGRTLYIYDVRQIMDQALASYGIEEWKACVMTDEFHGHLGVFSIIGAKMGIYAREYFGVEKDMIEITSFAGQQEPFSCMNDGLQVSTGATLGQGTIHLAEDTTAKPCAIFTHNNQSVMLTLKSEYLAELQAVISRGVKDYGLDDEDYWNLIRQTSIRYWLEWDRTKIFEAIPIP